MLSVFKYSLLFTLSMCLSFFCYGNEIDSIKTIDQLKKFSINRLNKDLKGMLKDTVLPDIFDPYKFDARERNENTFFKLDLDGNGLTDVIICGNYLLAITDSGNSKYAVYAIEGKLIDIVRKQQNICIIAQRLSIGNNTPSLATDTFTVIYGRLFEWNNSPDNFAVDSIIFSTSPGYGAWPVFTMSIASDRSIMCTSISPMYESDVPGIFTSNIDYVSFKNLLNTINYIKVGSLRNSYKSEWTDEPTADLKIKFCNGQSKIISDYGGSGTYGLSNLYQQLFELRERLKWEEK